MNRTEQTTFFQEEYLVPYKNIEATSVIENWAKIVIDKFNISSVKGPHISV